MSVSKSLFQIGSEMEALDQLLDEVGGDVTGEEETIAQWMEENADDLAKKIDGYAYYCEELEVRAEAIKEKQKDLQEARRALENRVERLKNHLQHFFEVNCMDGVEGKTRRAQLQRAGGRYPVDIRVDDPEQLPEQFRQREVTYRPDYDAILEAAGNEPGVVEVDGKVVAEVRDRGKFIQFY